MPQQQNVKSNKVTFTKGAEQALSKMQNQMTLDLIDYYRQKNFYNESDVIEITANDVTMFYRMLEIKRASGEEQHSYRRNFQQLILRVYSIAGLLLMIISIPLALVPSLFTQIIEQYRNNPVPFLLFLIGLSIFSVSIFTKYYNSFKRHQQKE
ncbi:MAG: hypothetical protein JXA06_12270 [Bacteroidetes bacterium]|nr:hypothetical protein [Bacteroidota bacterium]